MKTKRLSYLDVAKGFGILLVVFGHIEYISEEMRGWISSFHMPLFFVVSGMLICLKNEDEKSISDIFPKKLKGIIIPYLWFSLLYFFIDIMNVVLHKIDMKTFISNAISSLTFYGVSVLWFLPALFIGEIVTLLILNKTKKIYLVLPISLCLAIISYIIQIKISSIYEENINNIIIASFINFIRVFLRGIITSFFVAAGYYLYKFIMKKIENKKAVCLTSGIILFVANMFLCKINGCVDFHYIILKNVPVFYICAITGSMAIILISASVGDGIYLGKNKKKPAVPSTMLKFFGKNSLVIMATHVHCYVLYAGILVAWQIDTVVTRAKSYIFLFNIMLFTMLIETVIVLIVNKYFSFILGKSKKENV